MTADKNATVDELKTALAGVKQHMSISLATAVILKKKMEDSERPSDACVYAGELVTLEDRIAKGFPQSLLTRAVTAAFALMICSAFVSISVWLVVKALRLSGLV